MHYAKTVYVCWPDAYRAVFRDWPILERLKLKRTKSKLANQTPSTVRQACDRIKTCDLKVVRNKLLRLLG